MLFGLVFNGSVILLVLGVFLVGEEVFFLVLVFFVLVFVFEVVFRGEFSLLGFLVIFFGDFKDVVLDFFCS